jgi:hypothetical protein
MLENIKHTAVIFTCHDCYVISHQKFSSSHEVVVVLTEWLKYKDCATLIPFHVDVSWLRRYVTNQKVAGSRPDEVNDFYQFT